MHVVTFDQECKRKWLHGKHLANNLRETHKVDTSSFTTYCISGKSITITTSNMKFMIMIIVLVISLSSQNSILFHIDHRFYYSSISGHIHQSNDLKARW